MAQAPSKLVTELNKREAQALLDNRVFQQITEDLDTQYYQRWADNKKSTERDELWNQASAMRDLLGMIKYLANAQIDPEYGH